MLLSRHGGLPAWAALAVAAGFLAWAARSMSRGRRADVRLLGACLALGTAHLRAWDTGHPDPALVALGGVEHPVVVEGDVRAAWAVAGEYREEVRLDLALRTVDVCGVRVSVSGYLEARLEGGSAVAAGSRVRLRGFARPWRGARNPGGFDEASYARDRGLPFAFRAGSAGSCEVLVAPHGWRRLLGGLREGMVRRLTGLFPGERGGLLATLLVGAPWDFPGDLEEAFRRTGTVHLLSISGLHLGIVAGAVWVCVRRLAFLGPARFAIAALLVLLYAVLVGPLSPVVRSAVLVLVFLAARASGRRADAWNLLALAAGLILAVFPAELFRLGFQLSFLACAGIILSARLPLPGEGRPAPVRWALRSLAVSFGASAAVTPLLWHHFHFLSPVSLLANLPLVPLLGVVLLGAFLSVALGGVPLPGGALVRGTDLSVRLLAALVRLFGAVPGGSVALAGPSAASCTLLYVVIGALVACTCLSRTRFRGAAVAVLACVLVGACVLRPLPRTAGVVFLDVGHGSASVFWDGKGGVAACDCGTSGREVAACLWSLGFSRLDALFLSHPNRDHDGGVSWLARHVPIGTVVVGEAHRAASGWARRAGALEALGVRVRDMVAGDTFRMPGGSRVSALYPARGGAEGLDPNDASLVVLWDGPACWSSLGRGEGGRGEAATVPRAAVLWPGDLEPEGAASWRRLWRSRPEVRCGVVALPHHGEGGEGILEWVTGFSPRLAVASAAEGFASEDLLDGLRGAGVEVLGTWEGGAVLLRE